MMCVKMIGKEKISLRDNKETLKKMSVKNDWETLKKICV